MKINKFPKYLIIVIIILLSYSFLKFNEVSKELTKDDIFYIELLLDDFGINKKVVKIIKEKLNIKNKNIIFKNIQNNIHYEKNPKIYKPRKGIKFKLKKKQSFKKNLINLLN